MHDRGRTLLAAQQGRDYVVQSGQKGSVANHDQHNTFFVFVSIVEGWNLLKNGSTLTSICSLRLSTHPKRGPRLYTQGQSLDSWS